MNFIFFPVKKIKNGDSEKRPEAVGEEVFPVAGAVGNDEFLHEFGQAAIGDADDEGEEQGPLLIGFALGGELFAIAPETGESEAGVHACVH